MANFMTCPVKNEIEASHYSQSVKRFLEQTSWNITWSTRDFRLATVVHDPLRFLIHDSGKEYDLSSSPNHYQVCYFNCLHIHIHVRH